MVEEKRHYAVQRFLRGISIHFSRIVAALDPFLASAFKLAHPVAQQMQIRELVQFFRQRFPSSPGLAHIGRRSKNELNAVRKHCGAMVAKVSDSPLFGPAYL
jgi:hypothetical protein